MKSGKNLQLPFCDDGVVEAVEATAPPTSNQEANRLCVQDRAAHEWYRFVLSFPPHLVREYLQRFAVKPTGRVLDPFCGTGTTLVECKKLGIPCIGVEANPMAHFASQVKLDWSPDPEGLVAHANRAARKAKALLRSDGIEDDLLHGLRPQQALKSPRTLPVERLRLLLTDSISPIPLHKTLVLLGCLDSNRDDRYWRHERLALAKALVSSVSNLKFGPEVGVGSIKQDAPVLPPWITEIQAMAEDLKELPTDGRTPATVHLADARKISQLIEPTSVDVVVTSPPYPNEKDYTRTTRLESVLLGFIRDKSDLRALKKGLVRSNTRSVYKTDDDDQWVGRHAAIQQLAQQIEDRRRQLGKTSGFERLYARVTKLYFGGMTRHLAELRFVLRPGARLAYVVGDQASYLQVMIRTGQLIADIAQALGYELEGIDLFRTRLATATRQQLREEVVLLRWPGFN